MPAMIAAAIAALLITSGAPFEEIPHDAVPVLSVLRASGALAVVAADPLDARRIFAGTDAGTVWRSVDGGATWDETSLEPRIVREHMALLSPPALPELGERDPNEFELWVDPPEREYIGRGALYFPSLFFDLWPPETYAGYLPRTGDPPATLLSDATASRREEMSPVHAIAFRGENVLAATERRTYASTDGGQTWLPFDEEAGELATPDSPGWFTDGRTLFTTHPLLRAPHPASASWANARLAKTPPMHDVVAAALDATQLAPEQIDRMRTKIRARNWLPQLSMWFESGPSALTAFSTGVQTGGPPGEPDFPLPDLLRGVPSPVELDTNEDRSGVTFLVQLVWTLNDLPYDYEEDPEEQATLHTLSGQIAATVEDACYERTILLRRLAAGAAGGPLEIEISKDRVVALEALLATWTRSRMEDTK